MVTTKSMQIDGQGASDYLPMYNPHHDMDNPQTDTTCKILMDSDMVSSQIEATNAHIPELMDSNRDDSDYECIQISERGILYLTEVQLFRERRFLTEGTFEHTKTF